MTNETFNQLPLATRSGFFASGNITVGILSRVDPKTNKTIRRFVGKVRGIFVENERGQYTFETAEQARATAVEFRAKCRADCGQLKAA